MGNVGDFLEPELIGQVLLDVVDSGIDPLDVNRAIGGWGELVFAHEPSRSRVAAYSSLAAGRLRQQPSSAAVVDGSRNGQLQTEHGPTTGEGVAE